MTGRARAGAGGDPHLQTRREKPGAHRRPGWHAGPLPKGRHVLVVDRRAAPGRHRPRFADKLVAADDRVHVPAPQREGPGLGRRPMSGRGSKWGPRAGATPVLVEDGRRRLALAGGPAAHAGTRCPTPDLVIGSRYVPGGQGGSNWPEEPAGSISLGAANFYSRGRARLQDQGHHRGVPPPTAGAVLEKLKLGNVASAGAYCFPDRPGVGRNGRGPASPVVEVADSRFTDRAGRPVQD